MKKEDKIIEIKKNNETYKVEKENDEYIFTKWIKNKDEEEYTEKNKNEKEFQEFLNKLDEFLKNW